MLKTTLSTSRARHLIPGQLVSGLAALAMALGAGSALAQRANDAYRPPADSTYDSPMSQAGGGPGSSGQGSSGQGSSGQSSSGQGYGSQGYGQGNGGQTGGYGQNTYGQPQTYGNQGGQPYQGEAREPRGYANNGYGAGGQRPDDSYRAPPSQGGYGEPYSPPAAADQGPPPRYDNSSPSSPTRGYYSQGEIADKGRGFFGSITQGLASAIEYTYQQAGRPNGYILGEDGGGAFFAGLRYGEGTLYTKDAGDHKVFWQGPSLGYDVGGEGSKVMVLVYNLADPGEVFHRFGGVEGSAYLVGGVSVQFQKHDDVTLAVIRSGVGLRLGANIGYLKYTRSPTWNPF